MTKLKGKIPSLLSQSTGKPSGETSQRKNNCSRCKVEITMGTFCFKIPKSSNGFTNKKIHCVGCMRAIIEQTKKELQEIEDLLGA